MKLQALNIILSETKLCQLGKKYQTDYIIDNIEDIFMYDCSNKNNSPINGTSKLLVIKKK